MKKETIIFIFSFVLLLAIQTATAVPQDSEDVLFHPINYSAIVGNETSNATYLWLTAEGILNNTVDILHNLLNSTSLLWSNAGHIIDTFLDMNNNPITEISYLDFILDSSVVMQEGRLWWDENAGTLSLGLPGGNVNLQIGQEQLLRAKNTLGTTIFNGQIVYINGADGSTPTIILANATTELSSSKTIGMATEDITNNQLGFITTFGLVRGINTSTFSEGAMVWLSTVAGNITTTIPTSPNHAVFIGNVIRSHATEGIIHVKIQNGFELGELHDINITGITNEDIIIWNESAGVWQNIALSEAIASTTYLPTSFLTLFGTENGGNNIGNLSFSDDETFNISELSGLAPVLELYINFTNVTKTPDFMTMGHRYIGTHFIQLQLWDYEANDWETYDTIAPQGSIIKDSIPIVDGVNHVQNEIVQARFIHPSNGVNTNKLVIDFLNLVNGFSTITTAEHDGLSGRDDILMNHPNSEDIFWQNDGTGTATGNWSLGGYNLTLETGDLFLTNNSIWLDEDQSARVYMEQEDVLEIDINNTVKLHLESNLLHGHDIAGQFLADESIVDVNINSNCSTVNWTCGGFTTIADGKLQFNTTVSGGPSYTTPLTTSAILPGRTYALRVNATEFVGGTTASVVLELGGTAGLLFKDTGLFMRYITATTDAAPRIKFNGGIGGAEINITSIQIRLLPELNSYAGDLEVWQDLGVYGNINAPNSDSSFNSLEINMLPSVNNGPELTALYVKAPDSKASSTQQGGNITLITGKGSFVGASFFEGGPGGPFSIFLEDGGDAFAGGNKDGGRATIMSIFSGRGGQPDGSGTVGQDSILKIFPLPSPTFNDTVFPRILMGMDNTYAGGLSGGRLQVNGSVVATAYLTATAKDKNYIPMTKFNNLSTPNNALGPDGKFKKESTLEGESIYYEWIEYPYMVEVCGDVNGEVLCAMNKDKSRPVYKNITLHSDTKALFNDRLALIELSNNIELSNGLTVFKNSTLAEHYITNTTKDLQTMTKISNFRNTLVTKTFQQVQAFVLTVEGKLSNNILFDSELSEYGSYDLGGVAHFNRAMTVFLMWENLQQQKEIDELTGRTEEICNYNPSFSWC